MTGRATSPAAEPASRPLSELTLDEATRPRAAPIPGATAEHRRRGRHLADVHRMYLAEIDEVGRLIERVRAGHRAAADLAAAIQDLEIGRNYRAFGTLCGRQCYALTVHHTIEDRQLFPVLHQRGDAALRAVVTRLQEEHLVVHALIERLDQAAAALTEAPSPATFAAARETFRALERAVRSHFGYEEAELEEALGFHGIL